MKEALLILLIVAWLYGLVWKFPSINFFSVRYKVISRVFALIPNTLFSDYVGSWIYLLTFMLNPKCRSRKIDIFCSLEIPLLIFLYSECLPNTRWKYKTAGKYKMFARGVSLIWHLSLVLPYCIFPQIMHFSF